MKDYDGRSTATIIPANSFEGTIPYSWSDIGSIVSRAKEYVHDFAATNLEAKKQERVQSRTEAIYDTMQPQLEARFMEPETYLNHLKTKNDAQRALIVQLHSQLIMNGEDLKIEQAAMKFVKECAKDFADCYKRRTFRQYAHEMASQEPMTLTERMLGYVAQKTA